MWAACRSEEVRCKAWIFQIEFKIEYNKCEIPLRPLTDLCQNYDWCQNASGFKWNDGQHPIIPFVKSRVSWGKTSHCGHDKSHRTESVDRLRIRIEKLKRNFSMSTTTSVYLNAGTNAAVKCPISWKDHQLCLSTCKTFLLDLRCRSILSHARAPLPQT